MSNIKPALAITIATLAIFLLTKNPFTSPFKLQMAFVSLAALIIYTYLLKRQGGIETQIRKFIFLVTVFILFLVAATGWFFSPFFFTLYLIAVFLSFIFPLQTALSFVITLVLLFSFNIGEVDITYDFLVILSLLSVVPLSFYLRAEYLRLKEAEKEILVMQKQQQSYKNKVEEALANIVINFAADIRQPINDTKQLAFRLQQVKTRKNHDKYVSEIITLSEKALRTLKGFEENATGTKLANTPAVSTAPSQTLLHSLPADQD